MRISRTDPVKRTGQPFGPRLSGTETAARYGYSAYHFHVLMREVTKIESRLLQLFGPAWAEVKLETVSFVDHDSGLKEIGLKRGCHLAIAADKLPPAKLLRSLELDLAHEYAHALLLNRRVLDRSLPARHKAEAGLYFGRGGELDLDSLAERDLARILMWSLETGLDNPYVSGLQSGYFRRACFGDWLWHLYGSDDHLPEYMDSQLFLYSYELVTEKIAGLIASPTGRLGLILREHLEEGLSSIKYETKFSDADCLPFAALKRVYAEKTGNGDLLHYLAGRKFAGSPYEALCAALSELWDKIGLKTV